jgi:NAD(P)-dependent dehydrogenase (short-subunit alcohol dehydrogenase family)
MTGRMAGQRALITGASRGIGRAIAEAFAREGARLALHATTTEGLAETRAAVEALGAEVSLHAADVSDPAQAAALVEAAAAALGGLDVAVNNAGIYRAARFTDYAPEDFDRVMKVNAYGVFHCMQAQLRRMQAQGGGAIVNIASTAGKHESANQAAYNASKHAVVGLTRCAAVENAAAGITVNAICPGFVETDMLDEFQTHADIHGVTLDQIRAALLAKVPMGRMLQPEEIAHLAVYLASGEAAGMTGQALTLSGGLRMG